MHTTARPAVLRTFETVQQSLESSARPADNKPVETPQRGTAAIDEARADDRAGARNRPSSPALIAYGFLGALLGAYVLMLLLANPGGRSSNFLGNWVVDGFELVVALLCVARALTGGPRRFVALALGTGLLAWSLGDILWSVETLGGRDPSTPSPADLFYILFYPLACAAIVLLMRKEVKRLPVTSWLDGIMTRS